MVNEFDLIREVIQNLPPELNTQIASTITIFKAVGIIFIIYLIFLMVKIIFDIRSKIFIKKTYEKVNEIDKKLEKALKKRK